MKLLSFRAGGQDRYGIATDQGVIDLSARLGANYPTLRCALAEPERIRAHAGASPDFGFDAIEYLPTITDPLRVVCVGLNYRSHIEETGRDAPTQPILFVRFPDSHVGHQAPMVRPKVSTHFDFEGELAVVIGKPGRHVSRADALDHVAGYACYNDGSVRDFQRHTSQFTPGKNFWHSGAFGPWMVTSDEIPDPSQLTLETRLNGEIVQSAATDDLLFDVIDIIVYISQVWPLEVGDVIATGTTGGVGAARKPPLWMKAGDHIEVAISKIGTLSNPIVDEAS